MADDFSAMLGTATDGAPAAPAGKAESFMKGMGLDLGKYKEQATAYEGAREKAESPYKQAETDLLKKMDESREKLKSISSDYPEAPEFKKPPERKETPATDPMKTLGSLASVLAVLGSLRTRAPLTSALNSMSAALTAAHQGDQERAKEERQKWQDQMETGLKENQDMLQKYTMALQKHRFNMDAVQGDFAEIAAEYQHTTMQAAQAAGSVDRQWSIVKDMTGMQSKAVDSYLTHKEHQEQIAATAQAHRDAMDARKDAAESKGWQVFQKADGSLVRINPGTGEQSPMEGDTKGLTKPGSGGKETESERKAAINYVTMKNAEESLEKLEKKGVTTLPASATYQVDESGEINAVSKWGIRRALSNDEQVMFQAARQFAEGAGHLKSGARINNQTLGIMTDLYIPVSGDRADVIARKKEARLNDLEAGRIGGGRAVKTYESEQEKKAGGGKSFSSEGEAEAAARAGKIKPGDKITIGGQTGTWQ